MSDVQYYVVQNKVRNVDLVLTYLQEYDLEEAATKPPRVASKLTVFAYPPPDDTTAPRDPNANTNRDPNANTNRDPNQKTTLQITYVQGVAMYSDGRYVYCTEDVIKGVPNPAITGVLIPPQMDHVVWLPPTNSNK